MKSKSTEMRTEKDSLGKVDIPADAYYGVQTMRAVHNFPVSGLPAHPVMVEAFVYIKKAAAMTNSSLGLLDKNKAEAIIKAADEILDGKHREHFVVDVYQAGAGTSHNMNTNEVLANRGIEILGGKRGDYTVINPNDDVNMAQSTNDTFPTAMRIASLIMVQRLLPVIRQFQATLEKKEKEFAKIIKSGRTHLQDAAPITLGQEFSGYAEITRKHYELISDTKKHLSELGNFGRERFTFLNDLNDEAVTGSTNVMNIGALLKIRFLFDDMVNVFSGSVRIPKSKRDSLYMDEEGNTYILSLKRGTVTRRYWVDKTYYNVTKYLYINKKGETSISFDFSNFENIGDASYAKKVEIRRPKYGEYFSLKLDSFRHDVSNLNMTVSIPSDYKRRNWK